MEQIGVPFPRFAARGVRNICLGPRAKNPALRGDHVVLAIVNQDEWVVRELREDRLPPATGAEHTGDAPAEKFCLVDVDMTGKTTVLHADSSKLFGDAKEWIKLVDAWSAKYGVQL